VQNWYCISVTMLCLFAYICLCLRVCVCACVCVCVYAYRVYASQAGCFKPDPRIFTMAMEQCEKHGTSTPTFLHTNRHKIKLNMKINREFKVQQ
jgi:hypothetical protein